MISNTKPVRQLNLFIGFVSVVIGACLGVIVLGLIAFCAFRPSIEVFLETYYGVVGGHGEPVRMTDSEAKTLTKMIENGAVISQADFLENITSFYSNIIAYLLGIIAVIGFLAIMYVTGVSKAHAETIVEKEIKSTLATRDFMGELAQAVFEHNRQVLDPMLNDFKSILDAHVDEVTTAKSRQTDFEERIDNQISIIAAALAEYDISEGVQEGENPNLEGTTDGR